MADIIKLGSILTVVTLVAAVALGYLNDKTAPIIAEQIERAKQEAMLAVTEGLAISGELYFDSLQVEDLGNPYESSGNRLEVVLVTDEYENCVGYIFTAYKRGYSSTIRTIVGTDTHGIVVGSTILFQQETPGLGAKAANPDWINQLVGLDRTNCAVDKDGGPIHSITGATITSRAVAQSVEEGLEALDRTGLFSDQGGVE